MNVDAMLQEITSQQFIEWQAVIADVDPWTAIASSFGKQKTSPEQFHDLIKGRFLGHDW